MKEKYDFNVCIECQKKNKDVPCDNNCKYLKEYSLFLNKTKGDKDE